MWAVAETFVGFFDRGMWQNLFAELIGAFVLGYIFYCIIKRFEARRYKASWKSFLSLLTAHFTQLSLSGLLFENDYDPDIRLCVAGEFYIEPPHFPDEKGHVWFKKPARTIEDLHKLTIHVEEMLGRISDTPQNEISGVITAKKKESWYRFREDLLRHLTDLSVLMARYGFLLEKEPKLLGQLTGLEVTALDLRYSPKEHHYTTAKKACEIFTGVREILESMPA